MRTYALVAVLLCTARAGAQCDAPEVQLFGLNVDPSNPDGMPPVSELRALGVRWARIEYRHWIGDDVYDRTIDALNAGGVHTMLLVDYASLPDVKPASLTTPVSEWGGYRAAFVARVRTIAAHFGDRVAAWEVWNEPDLFRMSGYDPGVPTAVFGPMLADAAAAVRASSHGTLVVGGLASGDVGYLRDTISAAGGSLAYDAVGIHPYGQRAPRGWPNATWGFGDMADLYDRYYAMAGRPLWVTEIGTDDSGNQADYLRNVYTLTRDSYLSRVPVVFWFCYSDGMVSPFGLVDASGAPKPAYGVYQSLAPDFDPACGTGPTDADGDGASTPADCDDGNAAVHPGAPEVCGNGIDDDCAGGDASCSGGDGHIYIHPANPQPGEQAVAEATHPIGLTNVEMRIAGPSGMRETAWIGVEPQGDGLFHWRWSFTPDVAGTYTASFHADPSAMPYATTSFEVGATVSPEDAGTMPMIDASVPGHDAGGGIRGHVSGCGCRAGGGGSEGWIFALLIAIPLTRWRAARRSLRRR